MIFSAMLVHPTVAIRPAPLIRLGAMAPIHLLPLGEKESSALTPLQIATWRYLRDAGATFFLLPLWEKVAERSSVG
ncbi:MAG: hypothetical protein EOQ47_18205 [Mesorhizobium sp.]|nr:MAG: hypothetical protein EOQ47_18205 [Mesorhizobium sp.]